MPTEKNSENISEFDKLWNYNKPDETERKFRELLPKIKNNGDMSEYLQLLTQIARTQGLQMKFDEAHMTLDEVKKLLTNDLNIARIRYFLERGRAYNSSKQKDRGKEVFLKAYELGLKSGDDFYTIDAAHMLGIIEPTDESLKWNEKAMEIAEKSKDERARGWLGSLYNNTGWTYHDKKDYTKALELFEKNVRWHTEKKSGEPLLIAKWCVARTLRSLDRVKEALEMQKKLLTEYEEKNFENSGYGHEEIAECNLILGNKEEAKKYFAEAYKILSKDIWLAEYEKDRLERLKKLGEV